MKAWVYQDDKQVKKYGPEKASWYVGWIDPEGKRRCKSCGAGAKGKSAAEKLRQKTEAELITGTYRSKKNTLWADFRKEYDSRIGDGLDAGTRAVTQDALNHFQRIVKPVKVSALTAETIDRFVSERRKERGRKRGSVISVATVNKELRHLRAVLRIAVDWGHLPALPRVKMLREPSKLPRYVNGDHFAAIYRACEVATMPTGLPNVNPADWWRGLLATAYLTGWRICELLAMKRADVDLERGTAVTRAEDNKGKRDELVKLHPVVLDHVRGLVGFDPCVFPWNYNGRTLYTQFARIQEAAGIKLPCDQDHEHSRFCHTYGFHDLRRAFATMNADKLTPDALQTLMRHKSYTTTQKYINMARQMDAAVAALHVPEVLKKVASGSA